MITTDLSYLTYVIRIRSISDGTYKTTIRGNYGYGAILIVLHDFTTHIEAENAGMDWVDAQCVILALFEGGK